jgi:chromate reductase
MKMFDQPVVRDPTPNSPREILSRLCTLLFIASVLGALVLFPISLAGRDSRLLVFAYVCGAAGLALGVTRRFWRTESASAARPKPVLDAAPGKPADAVRDQTSEKPGAARGPKILLLDASLAGAQGNSARLLEQLAALLRPHAELLPARLSGEGASNFAALEAQMRAADAFVFATGTHWDSWSSALQRFLEDATPAEATDLWLGKPAAVVVTEHSVGGKAVLSRLQGVLVTLGCTLPPLSGLVVSQAAQLARRHAPAESEDFWSAEDLRVVAHNLLLAARAPRPAWRAWPVDRTDYARRWVE